MRTVLAIEASNPSASAPGACVGRVGNTGVEVLGRSTDDPARASDGVMVAVSRACEEAGVAPADLDAVAVCVGPGGYTALRIATTSAKTLAFALGVPLIPVYAAEVAARSVGTDHRPALIALASKKSAAHLTLLEPDGSLRDLGVRTADAVPPGVRALVADAHLPEAFAARARELGVAPAPLMLSPEACLACCVGREGTDPDRVSPLYAREPDAVTQWRERHGSRS